MITHESRGRVGVVTLRRHERRNALDVEHLVALREAVEALLSDGVRSIVVTGEGTSFCAGADLGGVYGDDFRKQLYGTLSTLTSAPVSRDDYPVAVQRL